MKTPAKPTHVSPDCRTLIHRLRLMPTAADGPTRTELLRDRDKAARVIESLCEWAELSASGLRLRCGELSAQEIRTIRAVLNSICRTISPPGGFQCSRQ